jgi:hypothetical protein
VAEAAAVAGAEAVGVVEVVAPVAAAEVAGLALALEVAVVAAAEDAAWAGGESTASGALWVLVAAYPGEVAATARTAPRGAYLVLPDPSVSLRRGIVPGSQEPPDYWRLSSCSAHVRGGGSQIKPPLEPSLWRPS